MKSLTWTAAAGAAVLLIGALSTACHPTFVVLPGPEGDSLADTVRVRDTRSSLPTRRIVRVDTVERLRVDTVHVVRVDTVRERFGPRRLRVDTVRVLQVDTVRVERVDTVLRVDTVRVVETDTVVRTRTVQVPGRRLLFLPPGHFPGDGECRVWVHGLPPGRQDDAASCDDLGPIPDGAFILFGGEAWDFDYDWLAESRSRPGAVPPEIVALTRRQRR